MSETQRPRRAADVQRTRPPRAADGPLFAAEDRTAKGGTHRERAYAWMDANPWALPAFIRISLDMLDAGFARMGSKAIWENLRYQRRHSGEPLNNNHTRWVAEAAEAREPRLRGFFTTKKSRDERNAEVSR